MLESPHIDRICLLAVTAAVLLTLLLCALGLRLPQKSPTPKRQLNISSDYADTLFDPSYVHTINLLVSDVNWDFMVSHATEEEYVLCDAEIDGERISGIAIRPKGNSSLASIAAQGLDRFSFKIEFDHYQKGNTFHGLDKLALNNLGQDFSCMKDFLTYSMMSGMGVPGPLCAYTLVQKNGEDFGLYLAVEAIEDSFIARNFGNWTGNLYRPDVYAIETIKPSAFFGITYDDIYYDPAALTPGDRVDILGPVINVAFRPLAEQARISAGGYAGDSKDAYRVVFDTAVFPTDDAGKARYIDAVRALNLSDSPCEALDVYSICRYFAVHNFVNNYDSYTGIFAHNFYLCERDGKLSFIPWDYNLGFGAFSAESAYKCFFRDSVYYVPMDLGAAMNTEKSFVNYPIDTPLISVGMEDRPMLRCLLGDKKGLSLYHDALRDFLDIYFTSGRFASMTEQTTHMIRPFIEQGLTFYSPEDFDVAADAVLRYGLLRAESISGQLSGDIPATMEGQRTDYKNLIETDNLDLSRTIDFSSLAFGITSKDVIEIVDAIFDGAQSPDIESLASDLSENPSHIGALIMRLLRGSRLLSGAIASALTPPLLLLLSLVLLLFAIRRVRRSGGERRCN